MTESSFSQYAQYTQERLGLSRRDILKGVVLGAGFSATGALFGNGIGSLPALATGKSVEFGSYSFDPAIHLTEKMLVSSGVKAGFDINVESVEHLNFQSQINSYFQGSPSDVVDFHAGYRLQYLASKGLATDISDVWSKVKKNFARSYQTAVTAADGKQYLMPLAKYPWAVMYRKSIFKAAGIDANSIVTWNDFLNACSILKSKGLTPIALGSAEGWEAMGTFDFINMRTNGFKFHGDLLAGRVAWSDDRVQKSFRNWETMFPFQNSNVADLDWAGAGRLVVQMKAAMQIMGSYHAQLYSDPDELSDLALFPFPEISKAYKRDSLVAPVNGYVIPKSASKNLSNAKALITWFGSVDYSEACATLSPTTLFANSNVPVSENAFVRQQLALVNSSKYSLQFLDRVTRPDFANSVIAPAFQSFLKNPGDKKKIAANMASQWRALSPD